VFFSLEKKLYWESCSRIINGDTNKRINVMNDSGILRTTRQNPELSLSKSVRSQPSVVHQVH